MKNLILLTIGILTTLISTAQKEAVEKVWFNPEKTSKIQIYKAVDGNLYGRVIWLKEPMVIIKKFKKASSTNEYEDGTVYDPLSGKTYCGTMSLNGKELKLRGFICGINFVGRTSIWTSAE